MDPAVPADSQQDPQEDNKRRRKILPVTFKRLQF
jgi:hypothetical protein